MLFTEKFPKKVSQKKFTQKFYKKRLMFSAPKAFSNGIKMRRFEISFPKMFPKKYPKNVSQKSLKRKMQKSIVSNSLPHVWSFILFIKILCIFHNNLSSTSLDGS